MLASDLVGEWLGRIRSPRSYILNSETSRPCSKMSVSICLDDVALIAGADHEVIHAMGGIDLHDVPQYRLAADFDHRLRLQIGLFAESRTESAGENDSFHALRSSRACALVDFPSILGSRGRR